MTVLAVAPTKVNKRLLRKFLVGDDCWEWQRAKSGGGYGASWDGSHHVAAHRHVYQVLVGPIPGGLTLDHLCRNRACVRPDHLEPVTTGENTRRGDTPAARNLQKVQCPAGHPFDEANTYQWRNQRRCRECMRQHSRAWKERHGG